ncbi:membrane-associated guanylate kinase: WW and PDZ domain-containing protein 2-like protein [Dinothrombium tinctorium]|uniref:Membrane-associated guanylate kinase: WW and PDZ domain-containing protein 2-like protein n=1 Tax=Dinothrombium tinctorium TaxID=1965070 RepID=A0A443RRV0_9ACAR|nr:membrane-associated guanylate kinase: WW and PDZ domain-containing protein 2-like protein [Dinothrombium tinctorium]
MSNHIYNNEPYQENGNPEDVFDHRKTPPMTSSDSIPSLPQLRHWSEVVYECLDIQVDDWNIAGGSDYGQLPYLINSGDILLEIDGHKVAGYTRNDVLEIVRSKPLHDIKAVSSSSSFGLPIDLREYLSRRFVRGSIDQDLQATIRDNVYFRTIPCTTRPPRPSEIDGVDYKFVSREVFMEMEKSGVLLESGVYAGHFYGTPLPLSTPSTPLVPVSSSLMNFGENGNDPSLSSAAITSSAVNPSSSLASKRRRNRSNIAAIDASSLPHGWEKISDAHYGVYYIDHINKRTQYERPYELELVKGANGFGFTLIELDKGLVVVKNIIPGGPAYLSGIIQPGDVLVSVSGVSVSGLQHSDIARLFATFSVGDRVKLTFARGYQLPPELCGDEQEYDYVPITLTKGVNGFGFTISDGNSGQKVKKILDVERCGLLRQGDILANINGIELLSLSHLQVVDVLKQCPVGEPTSIVVKRKKRFRSKTPITLQSSEFYEKENNIPPRNCKTPSCEMMLRKDLDWMTTENNNCVNSINSNMSIATNYDENYNQDVPNSNYHFDYTYPLEVRASQPPSLSSASLRPSVQQRESTTSLNLPQASPMATNSDITTVVNEDEYEYYRASLTKGEAGFGFRIVGGAEEGRNVAIGSIVIGGVAHRDGILKAGDEIISINDRNVMGASHHHVVELMAQCGATVSLLVRRKKDSDAFDVVLNRESSEGFGFVIISCGNCALIGRIIDGSPAQRCQRLRIRDRIIAVNGVDISNMSHPDIVNMIKESGKTLRLRIIPADCYTVELIRGPKGFGFSIRGGAEFNGMPLFILRIAPDGPAFSLLNVGDEIIEINNISTVGMTHADAVQLISQSGPQVKLKLRRNATINAVVNESNLSYGPPQMAGTSYSYYYNSYSAPNLMLPQTGAAVSPHRTNSSYLQ